MLVGSLEYTLANIERDLKDALARRGLAKQSGLRDEQKGRPHNIAVIETMREDVIERLFTSRIKHAQILKQSGMRDAANEILWSAIEGLPHDHPLSEKLRKSDPNFPRIISKALSKTPHTSSE